MVENVERKEEETKKEKETEEKPKEENLGIYDNLSQRALAMQCIENDKVIKNLNIRLEEMGDNEKRLKNLVEEKEKIFREQNIVPGFPADTLLEIKNIAANLHADNAYARYLEWQYQDNPVYFMNAVYSRASPLYQKNKQILVSIQVDESGETLITNVEDIWEEFFRPYLDAGEADQAFWDKFEGAAEKFKTHRTQIKSWQQYMIERSGLDDAVIHAWLYTVKARQPDTPLVTEIKDIEPQENKKLMEMEEKLKTAEKKISNLIKDIEQLREERAEAATQSELEEFEKIEKGLKEEGIEGEGTDEDEETSEDEGTEKEEENEEIPGENKEEGTESSLKEKTEGRRRGRARKWR